ncbi:MAG: hypothetical protein WEB88_04920 [Gemmatimonadota bacterium]
MRYVGSLRVSGRLLLGVLLLLVAGATARPVAAQSRADSAAVLVAAAERFEAEGREDVADALYRMVVARFAGTPAADMARAHLAALPAERRSRAGMAELTVWGTLFGLWAGITVPYIVDSNPSAEAIGAGLLIGGPVGFLGSRAYARSRELSEGAARAITFGGTWGTWQALGWRAALNVGTSEVCADPVLGDPGFCYEDDADASTVMAWGLGGTVLGTAAGMALSRLPITAGTASAVSFGGLWGTWYGAAASQIFSEDPHEDTVLAMALLGGNAGIVTAALAAPRMELSRNRSRLISIAGVVGLLGGMGLDLILQPDDARVAFLIPAVTSAAGLAYGVASTRDYDRSTQRGGGQEAGSGALLRLREGTWSVDLPRPYPRVLREQVPGRPGSSAPTLGITLLDARFF